MGVAKRDEAIERGDITAIAMYIYRAKRDGQESVDITIHGFTFQCNPQAGVIKHTLNQVGSINQKLSEKSTETYLFNIQQGLVLAAKIHLLLELKKKDKSLSSIINVNIETGTNLDTLSVNNILGKLIQTRGATLTTLVGMFAARTPASPAIQVVQQELKKAAIASIHSFHDADLIFQNIANKLTPQPTPPRPTR